MNNKYFQQFNLKNLPWSIAIFLFVKMDWLKRVYANFDRFHLNIQKFPWDWVALLGWIKKSICVDSYFFLKKNNNAEKRYTRKVETVNINTHWQTRERRMKSALKSHVSVDANDIRYVPATFRCNVWTIPYADTQPLSFHTENQLNACQKKTKKKHILRKFCYKRNIVFNFYCIFGFSEWQSQLQKQKHIDFFSPFTLNKSFKKELSLVFNYYFRYIFFFHLLSLVT